MSAPIYWIACYGYEQIASDKMKTGESIYLKCDIKDCKVCILVKMYFIVIE